MLVHDISSSRRFRGVVLSDALDLPEYRHREISSNPLVSQILWDLAENRRFQGFLKEILEIENRANLRFARNLVDFNTLVLKSNDSGISENP